MLPSLFDSGTLPLLEKMAMFGERRQQVLAQNIAHAGTPNYRMQDLDVEGFQQALRDAVQFQQRSARTGPAATEAETKPAALRTLFSEDLFQARDGRQRNITFQDGNNRSIEYQVAEMQKNNMMQRFAIELMTSQMNMLQTAISERV